MHLTADLHIHSCLSPCGSLEMSPRVIVETAAERGTGIIAVTDHNSALNCATAENLAGDTLLVCFSGIEITTMEEVHVLAIFGTAEEAERFGSFLYSLLPDIQNEPEKLGDQVYVDADEMIIGEVEKYLGNGIALTIDETVSAVLDAGGLCIPAHIDRPLFGAVAQLGFLPPLPYSGVETVELPPPEGAAAYPVIRSSDAHLPEQIGRRVTELEVDETVYSVSPFDAVKDAFTKGKIYPR